MSHDYLREMIAAAEVDGESVVLSLAEAHVLVGEFDHYFPTTDKQKAAHSEAVRERALQNRRRSR